MREIIKILYFLQQRKHRKQYITIYVIETWEHVIEFDLSKFNLSKYLHRAFSGNCLRTLLLAFNYYKFNTYKISIRVSEKISQLLQLSSSNQLVRANDDDDDDHQINN